MKNRNYSKAFIVGFITMLIEMVLFRYLWVLIGSSVLALATITALFMSGFSLGEFAYLKLKEVLKDKTQYTLILGFMIASISSPLLLGAHRPTIGLLIAFIVALILGMMMPHLMQEDNPGGIYRYQTLGSVVGVLSAHFIFIPYVGLKLSALLCGLLSIAILNKETVSKKQKQSTPAKFDSIMIIYGLLGFLTMSFQTYFIYVLVLFFSNSAYDYGIILAVYLIGGYLGNQFISKKLDRKTKSETMFFNILMGTLVSLSLSVWLVKYLPYLTVDFINQTTQVTKYGSWMFVVGILKKGLITTLYLGLPTFFNGMIFPVIAHKLVTDKNQAAISLMMGLNTLGSCLGSLISAYVLIGLIGIQNSMKLNIIMGLILLAYYGFRVKVSTLKIGIVAVAVSLFTIAIFPWNTFQFSSSFLQPNQNPEGYFEVDYYKEDAYGLTSVINFKPNETRYLTTNRIFSQNTSGMGGLEDHRRMGYIPVLLSNNLKNILMTGMGAGVTLKGVSDLSDANIDVVEISNSVIEAASIFESSNGGVLKNENVTIIQDDARNYMSTTKKKYDLIIGDIFFPMSQGASNLFSKEYYTAAYNRLEEGGMMMQWIPTHQFNNDELLRVIKTYASVFTDSSIWYGMVGKNTPAIGLMGYKGPEGLSYDVIKENYEDIKLATLLEDVGLDNAYRLLSHYIAHVAELDLDAIKVYRDDKPQLEYKNPTVAKTYMQRSIENMKFALNAKAQSTYHMKGIENADSSLLKEYNEGFTDLIKELFEE